MVREEVREHRYQAIPIPPLLGEPVYHRNAPRRSPAQLSSRESSSSHLDDDHHDDNNGDWATRCLLPSVVMLPSVILPRDPTTDESRSGRRRRRLRQYGRKATSYCCSRSCTFLLAIVVVWNVVAEDWWWPLVTWKREDDLYPTKILIDFANVASVHDLNLDSIKEMCQETRPQCKCDDPLKPVGRQERANWEELHQAHVDTVQKLVKRGEKLDVLFLGDSITEGWSGKFMGQPAPQRLGKSEKVFASLFSKEDGGRYQGLALGISGDKNPNLLWRIQNGELHDKLNPAVIWVLIGTNDLGNAGCSAEAVVMGIVRVVEELLGRKPKATIVINGLLPRTFQWRGYVHRTKPRWWGSSSSQSNNNAAPQLYEDIQAINDELNRYATHRDRVAYFETKAFWEKPSAQLHSLRIDHSLMPDYLHPNEKGYRKWGNEIVAKLDQILERR